MTLDSNARVIHREVLRGGQMWSRIIRKGEALRITDADGGAALAALFYNPAQPLERYNMSDTLKGQHTARLTQGHCLYSDMGRIFFSITEDTCGWHDTITGHMNAAQSAAKFGPGGYRELKNDFHRNSRDNLLIELSKYGLGLRDLVPNVNFFVKVAADAEGRLTWKENSEPGACVVLRAEMDTLIIASNTPHPLDPATEYAPKPLELSVETAAPAKTDDLCRNSREENQRGFLLTQDYTGSVQ